MCGVDAIQYLTGCTFGKGNLIHLDYGKNAFTFWRRSDGKGIRIVTRPEAVRDPDDKLGPLRKKMQTHGLTSREQDRLKAAMSERIRRIMSADWNDLFHVHSAQGPIPKKARIMDSLTCQSCGEAAMESRTRRFLGQTLCIPCFEAMERRQG
jgi:formylmethanofuran dehydrogenase subunit E